MLPKWAQEERFIELTVLEDQVQDQEALMRVVDSNGRAGAGERSRSESGSRGSSWANSQ